MIEGRTLLLSSRARALEVSGKASEALAVYARTDASIFPRDAWLSRAVLWLAEGNVPQAKDAIDHAIRLNPEDYRVWKLQGELFLLAEDSAHALFSYKKAYEYGRYNDLGITRVLIELLRGDRAALDAKRHEFELLLNDFGLAIESNSHFIALSSNVEELLKISTLLSDLYPADASLYQELARRSKEHAVLERSRLSGRPRGLLW